MQIYERLVFNNTVSKVQWTFDSAAQNLAQHSAVAWNRQNHLRLEKTRQGDYPSLCRVPPGRFFCLLGDHRTAPNSLYGATPLEWIGVSAAITLCTKKRYLLHGISHKMRLRCITFTI